MKQAEQSELFTGNMADLANFMRTKIFRVFQESVHIPYHSVHKEYKHSGSQNQVTTLS